MAILNSEIGCDCGGSSGGGTPGGTSGQIQYNNAGAFGGFGNWDGTTATINAVSANLAGSTGLPISTGVSGLGTGVATFLATPSSANLAAAVTDEIGTGSLVFANTPTLITPVIGVATGTSLLLSGGLGRGAGAFGYSLDWQPTDATLNQTVIFKDAKTTTGSTQVRIVSGDGQSGPIQTWYQGTALVGAFSKDNGFTTANARGFRVYDGGTYESGNLQCTLHSGAIGIGVGLASGLGIHWWSGSSISGSAVSNITQISNGLLGIGTGAAASFAGGIKLTNLLIAGDGAGAASTVSPTNVTDTTTTNAYVIKGGQAATTPNTGWLKWYVGTTVVWVPYFANATP